MDTHPIVETEHPAEAETHEAGHGSEFYEQTNPKFFGLPLGVLIAAAISATAVAITLLKFVRDSF